MVKSPFYKTWDERVFARWIKYGLRDLPTSIHSDLTTVSTTPLTITPDASLTSITPDAQTERPVTLTTTKHQEVLTFMRANPPTADVPKPSFAPNRDTHPDVDAAQGPQSPFYRSESGATFARLPHLRPSVFYIYGDAALTELSAPPLKADRLAHTGTGLGGSGGVKKGRVGSVTFDGVGHLIPMEAADRTAQAAAGWLEPELERWRALEEKHRREWAAVPKEWRSRMSPEYVRVMKTNWPGDMNEVYYKESKL